MRVILIFWIALAALIYLLSAFVAWELNPGAWNDRFVPVMIWGVVAIYVVGIYGSIKQ